MTRPACPYRPVFAKIHDITAGHEKKLPELQSSKSGLSHPNPAQTGQTLYNFPIFLATLPLKMENAAMSDRWLSVEDIAAYLGVSKDTIYAWIANRNMPAHRVGRFWKFQKSEVELWVKAGGANDVKASAKE